MISTLLIEDEKSSRESLKDDLKNFCPAVQVIGETANVREGIELIRQLRPQLVFLDIELEGGTGFDVLDAFHGENRQLFNVVFTTSHNDFAIKAFRFSAIDYLLKPVDTDELVEAVKKAEERINQQTLTSNFSVLLDNLKNRDKSQKIALSTSEGLLFYKTDEIIRCESERNYTRFHFRHDKPLLVSRTLKEFEELLSPHGFERIHNSHIINIAFVKRYVKSEGGYLVMEDNSNVPVSPAKKDQLVKLLSGR